MELLELFKKVSDAQHNADINKFCKVSLLDMPSET